MILILPRSAVLDGTGALPEQPPRLLILRANNLSFRATVREIKSRPAYDASPWHGDGDAAHYLSLEVTSSGSGRAQPANVAMQARAVLKTETLETVANRGYFSSPENLACHEASITVISAQADDFGCQVGRTLR